MRSCVVASCPLGAGGARPRVEGAPRPPGSVRSGRTPGASEKQDPYSGGPRVRVPVSRVLISWKGGTPGCGVRADRARGSGTQAHPVEGRGRARNRHVRRRVPAPHRDVSVRINPPPGGCLSSLPQRDRLGCWRVLTSVRHAFALTPAYRRLALSILLSGKAREGTVGSDLGCDEKRLTEAIDSPIPVPALKPWLSDASRVQGAAQS